MSSIPRYVKHAPSALHGGEPQLSRSESQKVEVEVVPNISEAMSPDHQPGGIKAEAPLASPSLHQATRLFVGKLHSRTTGSSIRGNRYSE